MLENIPYTKLKFTLQLPDGGILPQEKTSALRGGMGRMLLLQHCVGDQDCEACEFIDSCIVRQTFYSRMDEQKRPKFVTGKESVGYLLECLEYGTEFARGSTFDFTLVLFGGSVAYFNISLQAFCYLGATGLGKYRVKFVVKEVKNEQGELIVSGNRISMDNFRICRLGDYVNGRMAELSGGNSGRYLMTFVTPLSIKYQGKYLQRFQPEALVDGARRRLMMLGAYAGLGDELLAELPEVEAYPKIIAQEISHGEVKRFSGTNQKKMTLPGIAGQLCIADVSEQCLRYLVFGELTHIGKNTSFGFGKYLLAT